MIKLNETQSLFLDLLRIVAVQLLVIGHALPYFNIGRANYMQNSAVVLFFVLSGIVISYSTFWKMENGYRFRDFFLDRFSRIYTAFIPSLLFIVLIDNLQLYFFGSSAYSYTSAFDVKTFLANLLMLQDFPIFNLGITSFGSGRPLWTLAIEWWLYMSFGMLLIHFSKQFTVKYLFVLCLFMIVPLHNAYTGRGEALTLFWLEGVMITIFLFKRQVQIDKAISILFVVITLVLIGLRLGETKEAYDLVYVSLISLFIVSSLGLASHFEFNFKKIKNYTHFIAAYSFTLFLVHYSIFDFIAELNRGESSMQVLLFAILISHIISACIACFTEMRYKQFNVYLKSKINYFGLEHANK